MSIIAPIYGVERYVGEFLESIAAQTFADYELLVVDDGSVDGSRAVVEQFAAADPRIRIIARANGGLGAARNTGVALARGRFLTFVDSDDVLPRHALELLVESAEATGSDIVVGGLRRFDRKSAWQPAWVDTVHLHRREGVTAEEFPQLLRNFYSVDKLFRRDFWHGQQLRFRQGVIYEDQPIITQLLARASSIDVLSEVVYDYRLRGDSSSISQQTASLKNLRDRVTAWQATKEALQREHSPTVYRAWLQTLFDAHFHWYLTSRGTSGDAYWTEIQTAVVELTKDAPREIWDATDPDKRVLIELARQNRRADVRQSVRRHARRRERWPSSVTDQGVLLHLPLFGDPDLDERLFLVRREQLTLAHSVETFRWLDDEQVNGPGCFEVTGWAYVTKVDLAERDSSVSVVLRSSRSGLETVHLSDGPVRALFPPPVDDDWCDYQPGTFRVRVRLDEVLAKGELPEHWNVSLRVSVAGLTVTEPVTDLLRGGSAGSISTRSLEHGTALVPTRTRDEQLRFHAVSAVAVVQDLALNARTLSGWITDETRGAVRSVRFSCGAQQVDAQVDRADGVARFTVDLPPASGLTIAKPARWAVRATTWEGDSHRLRATDDLPAAASGERVLVVRRNLRGHLAVEESLARAEAETVSLPEPGVLLVSGSVLGAEVRSVALVTQNKRSVATGPRSQVAQGRFEVRLPLCYEAFRFGSLPLPTGDHDVRLRAWTADEQVQDLVLLVSPDLIADLPMPVDSEQWQGCILHGREGGLRVSLSRPLGPARGRYPQHQLRSAASPAGELRRGLLLRSYAGRHATDHGVGIARELQRRGSDLPVYWAVQDYSVPVPEGGIPVIVNSREWYDLLGSVQYYVDDTYQPDYHTKPQGQVLVQTLRGYPFELMGYPHWRRAGVSQARIESYRRRGDEWDLLLSPARYATPLLTRDYGYQGEVLEIGYPRNDVLQSVEADQIRAATRRSLGIEDGTTAVLYAPRSGDHLTKDDARGDMSDPFDSEAAARALGDGFLLLVRGHAGSSQERHEVAHARRVVDVTDYPEVSDLYLAADAAIVDYSSLRFDFAVTGKPMIFYVPDLQRHRDTRGWLFDFESTAPGPLVETTAAVVDMLEDLDEVRSRHAADYASFRERFLDLEDGHASQRFVDAVFAPRGDG